MAGYTVDNQLKGAAEETTVAATVTAAETATAMETTVTARIMRGTPMLKGFSVGTQKTVFSEGRKIFWCQYDMLFLAGDVQFFLCGVLLTKKRKSYIRLCVQLT